MDKDSKPVSRRLTTSIVLVAVLGGLGTFVYRDLARVAAETRAADVEKPLLARDGNRVTVPPDSPLRNKLTIETVMEKDIQQKLVLPAVVEADPGASGQGAAAARRPHHAAQGAARRAGGSRPAA